MSIYQRSSTITESNSGDSLLLQLGMKISEVTADLLVTRGIIELDEARAFLNPSLDQLHDPYLLDGMDRAVHRIRKAVSDGEKIVIYGDYDADGVTSSSVLSLYLKEIGGNVDVFIPSRQEEGYGIHTEALQSIYNQGARLVITVDCGISAVKELEELPPSMDIIITDHHTPGPVLPRAYAVINPKIPGQKYPFQELAGVGVAAKLVQALGGLEGIRTYLDLVAIGTVADIVPLINENRVYAALGIEQLNQNPRPGISALIQILELTDKTIDAGKISYTIGPCLNAPGRMTTFRPGYDLLTSETVQEALPFAEELVDQNQLRKQTEGLILEAAKAEVHKQVDFTSQRVIVVAGEGWHPGVIGIVASRLTEEYCRPSIVLSVNGDQAVGSARSIRGFHIYDAISACSDHLLRFGGHEMAAGLSLPSKSIEAFRQQICSYAEEKLDEEALVPHYYYDGKLPHEQISLNLLSEIEQLAPFGFGNPAPRFLLPSAVVENSRRIGKDFNHIKLALSLGQRSWDAVGFGLADVGGDLQQGSQISLLTSLKRNEWMGVTNAQFQVHSLKRVFVEPKDVDDLLSTFHFKFFDVFFHYFMYNEPVTLSKAVKKPDLLMSCSEGQAFLTLDDTIARLKASLLGTVVFASTYETAAALLHRLLKENLLDRIPVQYHHPYRGNGVGRNSVVLVPDYQHNPEKHYRTVVTPIEEESLHAPLADFTTGKWKGNHQRFQLDTKSDGRQDRGSTGKEFDLSRDQLGILYKWLRKRVPGRNIWPDGRQLLQELQDTTGYPWTGFQLRLGLEIFKELDFIAVESGNQYLKIRCDNNPVNRQLDESRLVHYHRQWLDHHGMIDFAALAQVGK